jgi:hypothetical protein
MYDFTGKILTINVLSEKATQVVIKKTIRGKQTPIMACVFGYSKKIFDSLKFKKNDKISARLYLKSNLFKNKWYTDTYLEEIKKIENKPKVEKSENDLFEPYGIGNKYIVDEETGEILF